MPGKIYLLRENGSLESMEEQSYVSEDRLQSLLAEYPDLLAGDQIDEEDPRRWVLISREAGVPFGEGEREWMSVDHLFVDQDAVPTLVEVKRSTDTRIRREVVGQMLDYASHAVAYWSADRLREQFEAACKATGDDPIFLLQELLADETGDAAAVDEFWMRVESNLRTGTIRLVFVADEIPRELRRIVEFLNTYLSPTEVLAVEVRQFVGSGGLKSLVPQVIGQTTRAQARKSAGARPQRQWDEDSFFAELEERNGSAAVTTARQILKWCGLHATRIDWGHGATMGSFVPVIVHKERDQKLFAVWTGAALETYFYWYQYKPPFDSEDKRRELLQRLNAISGVSLPEDSIARRPSIPLATLADGAVLDQLLAVFDWVIEEIRAT